MERFACLNYPGGPDVIPGVPIKWSQEIGVEEGSVTIEAKNRMVWPQAKAC